MLPRETKEGKIKMNVKKLLILNPLILDAAKALYKNGSFKYASDSAFLRDVLETMATKLKKRGATK